jgi:dTDP-4-dehydrorhamnose reductase
VDPPFTASPTRSPTLLIGGAGMLGVAFSELLRRRGVQPSAPLHSELDISDLRALEAYVPDAGLVINCAAWTQVDAAEDDEAAAFRVNAQAVGGLARLCHEKNSKLVHFSSDYVFDGGARRAYHPDDAPCPVNAYGRSKAAGERLLRESGAAHLLIRTSWLYAAWGNNFVKTIAQKLMQLPELEVVDDQIGRPTQALHLASVALQLLERSANGTFHVTGGGSPCSWFDFARHIAACLQAPCNIRPCSSDRFAARAKRPNWSVLDTSRAELFCGVFPDWRDQVAGVCNDLSSGALAPPVGTERLSSRSSRG